MWSSFISVRGHRTLGAEDWHEKNCLSKMMDGYEGQRQDQSLIKDKMWKYIYICMYMYYKTDCLCSMLLPVINSRSTMCLKLNAVSSLFASPSV